MTRRLSLSLAMMLLVGLGLLVASGPARPAGSAGAAGEARKGGTLRVGFSADVDFVDPALAYAGRSWMLEYATCAKLFNYPDVAGAGGTRLVQEVVDRFAVRGRRVLKSPTGRYRMRKRDIKYVVKGPPRTAIDRPEIARTFGYLGGKRTDQLLPPALARPASIYPLKGADPATARKWLARATIKPTHARPLRGQHSTRRRHRPDTRLQPQADRDRRAGQVLRPQSPWRQGRHARGALRPRPDRLDRRLRRSGRFFVPLLYRGSGVCMRA